MSEAHPTRALIILQEFLDKILAGKKTWELRGSQTAIRGPIALIQSGSGLIMGTAHLVDSKGLLSLRILKANARKVLPLVSITSSPAWCGCTRPEHRLAWGIE